MVLETILTVIAWRKGWGPIALLPMAFALVWAVIANSNHQPLMVCLIGDAVAYAAFYFLIKNGRRNNRASVEAPAQVNPQVQQPAA